MHLSVGILGTSACTNMTRNPLHCRSFSTKLSVRSSSRVHVVVGLPAQLLT